MSATAKLGLKGLLSATAILVAGASAQAQDLTTDFFSSMTSQAPGKAASENPLEDKIHKAEPAPVASTDAQDNVYQKRIDGILDEMLKEIESPPSSSIEAPISIDDIDAANRKAAQLKAEEKLRSDRYDAMKSQLQMLVMLEQARKELHPNPGPTAEELAKKQQQNAQDQASKNEKPKKTPAEIEQSMMPRLDSVTGSGGAYTATLENPQGGVQDVSKGDFTASGFEVLEVTSSTITLKGPQTAKKYRLSPTPPKQQDGYGGQDQQGGYTPARDMGASYPPPY